MPTGQVWSSSTIMVPVPMRLPALATSVKSMGVSRCSSTMKSVEAPPGSRPRNLSPSRMPPACSSRISRTVVPMGSSQRPGRFTFPLAPKSLVPASLVRLKPRNHAAPLLMMWGTLLERLHVIDHGGFAEQAHHRRKRRLRSRVGALAFQRIQQPGLLAADVAAGAEVQVELEAVAGTEDVLAQIMTFVGFRDGARKRSAASVYSPRRKM